MTNAQIAGQSHRDEQIFMVAPNICGLQLQILLQLTLLKIGIVRWLL